MNLISRFSSSIIIFIHHINGLIFRPYKAIRKISQEDDKLQLLIIFGFIYLYFIYGNIIRNKTIHPFIISTKTSINVFFFTLTFLLVTSYFYTFAKLITDQQQRYRSYLFTFTYSMLPTYIWFIITSTLYLLIPPPRTASFPGLVLSGLFLVFSLTMFFWRINLLYLSIRFSSKMSFYQIVFSQVIFSLWFIPYCYFLYQMRVFRIPFI